MKTISTLFIVIAFANIGFSQPVISNVIPNFGDQMIYSGAEFATDSGPSGANVTWDFSELTINESAVDYIVNHPEDVEGSSLFPNATIAWSWDLGTATLNRFYNFANNEYAFYGYVFSNTLVGIVYDDPEVDFIYPINYQDTGNDSYAGIIVNGSITGTSSYIVDGYGTIITPYETYENVLRITSEKEETLVSAAGSENIRNVTTTSWFSPDYPVPVFAVVTGMSSVFGESFGVRALVSYTGVTGIDETDSDLKFEIYPNPATDYINITSDFQGVGTLSIFSIDGKLVARKSVQINDRVHLEKLQAGFYIARLQVADKQFTQSSFVVK